jgi:hypothetical protein
LKKDVENIESKQIFARWQAILSTFDFDIEYIKGFNNSILDFLIVNFCSATMASKKDKGKIDSKALVLKPESTPSLPDPPIYISLPSSQYLFSIEKNHSHITSPRQLALSYFPPNFYWIPEHPQKNLAYYTNILIQTKSIHFKPIFCKTSDSTKLLCNIAYFVKFISEKDWRTHPSTLRPFVHYVIPYSYYDYIDAWSKFMLFQTPEFNHFSSINFDKNFKGTLPLWFLQWWKQFGLIQTFFLPNLLMPSIYSRLLSIIKILILISHLFYILLRIVEFQGF